VRRIVIWLASTVTVVVLLFGYHTSTDSPATSGATTAPSSSSAPSSTAPSSTAPSSPSSSSPSASSSGTTSYTGDTAQTRWGPVQVKITVNDGSITKVTVPQAPSGNPRDTEINDQALPILIQETIDAQSARIDMVSGATVTSEGYVESLQSALDAAGI
jgi:uncharacterized protein with FMN-binding domain